MRVRKLYNDGGEIASTILQQLGGANRLHAMTGAYNFVNIGNGLSFKIKNQRANYIKITLTSMDLYDVEVGRIRGNTYKVVSEGKGMYAEELKRFIEKSTGMYLTLGRGFAKGGMINVKSDDGEDLMYKIDTDEKYIEVDENTKKYLSDIALVMDRNFRKLKDTYIFWYDDMSDSDITELEEVFQTSLNMFANGGLMVNDSQLTQIESDFKSFEPNVPFLPFYKIPLYEINVDKDNKIVTAEFYDESGVEKKAGSGEAAKYIFEVPYRLGKEGVFVSPQLSFKILKESYIEDLKNELINWAKKFYWYKNVELGFNYVDMDGGRIYKFSIKLISIPKIEPKKPEPKEEQTWTITYSTKNDNTDKVWVYGRNKDEAIENAKDEYWDIDEIISVTKMAKGGNVDDDDTFVMLFKGYGFVEKRGSYGTRTFYNIEHNAKIYYDPKYRSISGYVGGGEGNDEVIPYSVDGVLDFFIEHDITESEATPMADGGKIKEEEYKKLYTRLKQKKEKGETLDKREEYALNKSEYILKTRGKMADGGNVWDEDLNVYTLVSSKEYFGSDTASDKRRWFRRNGRGLSREQAKRMAQDYIDRYGKERVYIGNIRHYR